MGDRQNYSRTGTARALVLLAAALAAAGALLLCLLSVFLFARIAPATATFAAFVLVSAVVATLLTVRARSVRGVVGLGCGILLVGVVVGLGIMLLLISKLAGNPT
ncbi:hypothetical protein [Actinophytocola oryzae]|uniref:Uncharacterized protein n=1 Tax=Actinophytocola oryzae TaxID=502181 RepID=A0A4R7V339_9PSEU|nr:hypothetical protein [Actinophytocola oryzae]TDV41876.1 hypothetical protein CLV71_119198 [Actinophytocola oryzae]